MAGTITPGGGTGLVLTPSTDGQLTFPVGTIDLLPGMDDKLDTIDSNVTAVDSKVQDVRSTVDGMNVAVGNVETKITNAVNVANATKTLLGTLTTRTDSRLADVGDRITANGTALSGLSDKIDAIPSVDLTPTNNKIDAVITKVDGITMPDVDLTPTNNKIDAVITKIDDLVMPSVDLSGVQNGIRGIAEQMDGLLKPADVANMNRAIGTIGDKVATLENVNLTPTNNKIDTVINKIDGLVMPDVDLTPIEQKIDAIDIPSVDLTPIADKIDALNIPDLAPVNGKLNTLSNKIDSLNIPDLAPVTAKINTLSGKIDNLNIPDLGELTASVGSLDTKVSALNNVDLTPLDNKVDSLVTKIDNLDVNVDLSGITGGITTITDRIDTLTDKVDGASYAALSSDIQAIDTRLTALDRRFSTVASAAKIAELDSKIATLTQLVRDLTTGTIVPGTPTLPDKPDIDLPDIDPGTLSPLPDICIQSDEVHAGATRICAYVAAKHPTAGEGAETGAQTYDRITPVADDAETLGTLIAESVDAAMGVLSRHIKRSSLTNLCWDIWLDLTDNMRKGLMPSIRQALSDYMSLAVAGRWMLMCSMPDGKVYMERALESLKSALMQSYERTRPTKPE